MSYPLPANFTPNRSELYCFHKVPSRFLNASTQDHTKSDLFIIYVRPADNSGNSNIYRALPEARFCTKFEDSCKQETLPPHSHQWAIRNTLQLALPPLTKLQITPLIPLRSWAIVQTIRSTTNFKMENFVVFRKCIALGLSNPVLMNV